MVLSREPVKRPNSQTRSDLTYIAETTASFEGLYDEFQHYLLQNAFAMVTVWEPYIFIVTP